MEPFRVLADSNVKTLERNVEAEKHILSEGRDSVAFSEKIPSELDSDGIVKVRIKSGNFA